MINAHPIAVMVFWGGLTNWILDAILVGHHVTGPIQQVIAVALLTGWLVITLSRIGKLRELRESVQAIRALPAGPAFRVGVKRREGSAIGKQLPASETHLLYFRCRPERAVPASELLLCPDAYAAGPGQNEGTRSEDHHRMAGQGEEDGL
ncbi:MAG TPA: hypothetical protein VNL35_16845 [Chloroflexota bacterium]|nr:hypothetical protein [Chloroflexota bacterium]